MLSEEGMSHLKTIEEVMHSVNEALRNPVSWFDQQTLEGVVKKCKYCK
ncbi:hypothetical protein CULT_1470007 [[Clostridium] ultunense Esp]|nr:hypothetical protein CULT_1470007 [[Clostridium] ultunense Esp]